MRDPISDQLAALGADADRVVLADPADLRRAGTRRNRMRLAAAALAVLAVIGGAAVAFQPSWQALPPPPSTTPTVTPSPSSTADPTTGPTTEPTSVPWPSVGASSSVKGPKDLCATSVTYCYPPRVGYLDERLPAPCATTAHPSEAKLLARTSHEILLHPGLDPTTSSTYGSTMSTYTAGGASAYVAEVRSALARCPSVQRAASVFDTAQVTVRYRQVSTGTLGGDESVLACRTYETEAGVQEFFIAVERRGDRVLVVIDYGRGGVPSLPAEFDGFRDFDENARLSDLFAVVG
ncbi:hypothetical protein ACFPIJ_59935 [Dactylosporangium cerinum]|uniref:Uncharacterized protein n=1 Tax=Dactylosporangium cerinum TaxID=1434730 RepID=A0ABV9WGI2_9ACTN